MKNQIKPKVSRLLNAITNNNGAFSFVSEDTCRAWHGLYVEVQELVWARNYIDGYQIEVYELEDDYKGDHITTITIDSGKVDYVYFNQKFQWIGKFPDDLNKCSICYSFIKESQDNQYVCREHINKVPEHFECHHCNEVYSREDVGWYMEGEDGVGVGEVLDIYCVGCHLEIEQAERTAKHEY